MGVDVVITVTNQGLNKEEVRKLSSALSSRIGREYFWMDKKEDRHALTLNDKDNIEVNTLLRFYGPGYERGPWPIIKEICEFLQFSIPFGQVRYGGDSSDHHPLFSSTVFEINSHWLKHGYEPYRGYEFTNIECEFCKKPFHDVGGGGGATFLDCDGCGTKVVLDKDGVLHYLEESKEFFGWDKIGEKVN